MLEVLRDFGDNSIAASICPKKIEGSAADLGLGYRPAVASLVSRFRCAGLDADFVTDPSSLDYGKVPCSVVAVNKEGRCSCSGGGRFPVTPEARAALLEQLETQGSCGGSTGVACESYCLCELAQLSGPALQACQRDGEPMGSTGPFERLVLRRSRARLRVERSSGDLPFGPAAQRARARQREPPRGRDALFGVRAFVRRPGRVKGATFRRASARDRPNRRGGSARR